MHNLPIREIGSVGYLVKGRKVWFHTDSELQKLIAGTLIKGKGALWCNGMMQSAEKDNSMNSDEENADASPPTKKSEGNLRHQMKGVRECRHYLKTLKQSIALLILAHSTDCGPKQ